MEARRELIEAVGDRYRKSERTEKKKILDEFVELAGYHRKHAIRILGSEHGVKVAAPGMANRLYDEAVITALTIIWETADRICGKRLRCALHIGSVAQTPSLTPGAHVLIRMRRFGRYCSNG
jgi:hypothetical protein